MNNLNKLFYWRGVASDYYNYRGELVQVSLENRLRLLQAMGVNVDSQAVIDKQSYDLDILPWQHWFPSFLMTELGSRCIFDINLPPNELNHQFVYEILLESGGVLKGEFTPWESEEVGDYLFDGVRYSRRRIPVTSLPLGYHLLKVSLKLPMPTWRTTQLVVVPETSYTPEWSLQNKRPWGIIVQLYTLRTARNWGIGDFSDLKLLISEASLAGADMIGLNPLHVLRQPIEQHCSPYSPSDRRFISPLYIDPEIEPEYGKSSQEMLPMLVKLRAQDKVAYAAVYATKMPVFKQMYAVLVAKELMAKSARAQKFLAFVHQGGEPLRLFCLYQVLAETTGQKLADMSEKAIADACQRYAELMQFHAYLQWLASEQLEACQKHAKSCGMSIGLMRDLAVGADGGGAEVSSNLSLFCRDASVGAPPDPLAETGQNWGLPPMDPATLRDTGFRHFIQLLRSNMAHCGALRIDHAMALMRLWWCPPGHTADYGAYVYYPFRELLGLLKLESVRHGCLVIGEDMGVVPAEFRETVKKAHIFTNTLFYFEKNHDGHFKRPEHYPVKSLAMLTNHDVPTLASWWIGSDLKLREQLNLLVEGDSFDAAMAQREHEKIKLLEWLTALNLIKTEEFTYWLSRPLGRGLMNALMHGISQCASQLFVVQLEDLELAEDPVNVPGTSYQYPNWQKKLQIPLELLFADESVKSLMRAITMERMDKNPVL